VLYLLCMQEELISIIIGISLAILIYFFFKKEDVYHGPDSNIIKTKIYKKGNQCYKLVPKIYICSILK
jgi:ABC-type cobalt transport system substrate-binding protein